MAREVGARQVEGHALNTLGLDLAVAGDCAERRRGARGGDRDRARGRQRRRHRPRLRQPRRGETVLRRHPGRGRGRPRGHRRRRRGRRHAGRTGTSSGRTASRTRFDLGEWDEARPAGPRRASRSSRAAGRTARYGLSRWVPLLVAQGDERAGPLLEELRGCSTGSRSRPSSTTRSAAPSPSMRSGGASRMSRWRSIHGRASARPKAVSGRATSCGCSGWGCAPRRISPRWPARAATVPGRRRRSAPATASGRRCSRSSTPASDRRHGLDCRGERRRRSRPSRRNARASSTNPPSPCGRTRRNAGERSENPYLVAYCAGARQRPCSGTAIAPPPRRRSSRRTASRRAWVRARSSRPSRPSPRGPASTCRPTDAATVAAAATPADADDPFGLTRRERDVLPLLVKGRTNRQIAEELFISENTAGVHVSNILGKLGASTRTEAAGIAARLGLGID